MSYADVQVYYFFLFLLFLDALCVAFCLFNVAAAADSKNETIILDPFEEDGDLRFAADSFCKEYTLSNPRARKIALPYTPDCHYWWECSTYQLQKKECQGKQYKINLQYDLYEDRCEMDNVKCKFQFDEYDIIMEAIMQHYKKSE